MDFRETIGEAVKSLRKKTKGSSIWTKWFWYILAGSIGLLLVAYLVWESLNKSKKVAKALHERDVLLEKRVQEKVNSKIAESEKKKQTHLVKAEMHLQQAQAQEEKAKAAHDRAEGNKKLIDSLEDWDDVQNRIEY
jgi:Flp pilus assembly protein TadB